jgi:hypothetical protein
MKTPKFLLLLQLLWLPLSMVAQVQWYQNQDGNNLPPNGTFGTTAKSFTPNSFVACYQWSSDNELSTWKVSKSHINGTEQKSFFVTGTWASVEIRTGRYNTLYVLLRSYPPGENTVFKLFKLDSNLVVKAQRQIIIPDNFSINSINAFELDRTDNLYIVGDGQFMVAGEIRQASFVMKTDKNLNVKWRNIENSTTSFTRLHIESSGKVVVIEDHYTFFPQVKIRKYSSYGALQSTKSLETDAGRFNLLSKLDDDNNLLLYGSKTIGDTAQAVFLTKVSRQSCNIMYSKTHFTALGIQLNDLAIDDDGRIFSLLSQYLSNGEQRCMVSRINGNSGNVQWSRSYDYAVDSCVMMKLVIDESDRFYVLGEKRNSSFLTKGLVMRIKKNGQQDGGYNGPDSTVYQRSHSLVDGITDRNGQLITIGNTNDFDPNTYNSTYYRAFAVRFGQSGNHHGCDDDGKAVKIGEVAPATMAKNSNEEITPIAKLVIYPNPVQNELTISNVSKDDFDQVAIYNMQGALLAKQSVNSSTVRMDVTPLTNGVYLLVLRSSVSFKEKSIKFVVSK